MKLRAAIMAAAAMTTLTAFASSRIVLTEHRLMHETRMTPSPAEGDTVGDRILSFQWPLPEQFRGQYDPLDGFEAEAPHPGKSAVLSRRRSMCWRTDCRPLIRE